MSACGPRDSRAGPRAPRRRRAFSSSWSSASTRASTVACSFQKEASVVLDLLLQIAPDARVFTLDTHVLFPETYETWRKVEERYGIRSRSSRARASAARPPCTATGCGSATPTPAATCARSSRSTRALADVDAWIAGVRREQGAVAREHAASSPGTPSTSAGRPTRWPTGARPTSGATSPSTTCRTTELHDRGYASIGCTHCTQAGLGARRPLGRHRQGRVRHCTRRLRAWTC